MNTLSLSPEQSNIVSDINTWLGSGNCQELTLGGYAGTGKTTILKHLIDTLDDNMDVVVLAPTGKAAHVLHSKGVPAATIHSFLYNCDSDSNPPRFFLKDDAWADLLIIDEASMVSTDLYNDVLRHCGKVLWVGDHGQLEPVGQNPGLMVVPDLRLETIHRQAADNPIIRFAHHIRQGFPASTFEHEDDSRLTILPRTRQDEVQDKPDVILVGFNKIRHAINKVERDQRGLHDKGRLVTGDRIIFLQNNPAFGVFNGMLADVLEVHDQNSHIIQASVSPCDSDTVLNVPLSASQFGADRPAFRSRDVVFADYGYAVTVHKSQGSEWPTVEVFEQPSDLWSMHRWSYTAATRASQHLIYLYA